MSKKELLSETQVRRFQALANIPVLGESSDPREEARVANQSPPAAAPAGSMQEMDDPMADPMAALPAEVPPADDGMGDLEVDMGGGGEVDPDKQAAFEAAVKALADSMGIEVELEGGMGGGDEGGEEDLGGEPEGDMAPEMSPEPEAPEAGGEEEMDETLSEDELVETVLKRVMDRLVNEAKKKKLSVKEKMKEKKDKKEELDEATESKGGGPLLSKGGNKHDTFKGHADMKMGKGEKGGSGGHKMEDLPAKAEHTVTHGKTNLATKGGNKKKV
jgi:hypothetical protein